MQSLLESLPNELLLYICKFLDRQSNSRLAWTSKKLKQISEDDILWAKDLPRKAAEYKISHFVSALFGGAYLNNKRLERLVHLLETSQTKTINHLSFFSQFGNFKLNYKKPNQLAIFDIMRLNAVIPAEFGVEPSLNLDILYNSPKFLMGIIISTMTSFNTGLLDPSISLLGISCGLYLILQGLKELYENYNERTHASIAPC